MVGAVPETVTASVLLALCEVQMVSQICQYLKQELPIKSLVALLRSVNQSEGGNAGCLALFSYE